MSRTKYEVGQVIRDWGSDFLSRFEVVEQVRNSVWAVKGVQDVDVALVFEPEWTPERMSEEAKLMLNMY